MTDRVTVLIDTELLANRLSHEADARLVLVPRLTAESVLRRLDQRGTGPIGWFCLGFFVSLIATLLGFLLGILLAGVQL